MTLVLEYRRPDGSFVATIGGLPYHITGGDQHWDDAVAVAAEMGDTLPFEPVLVPPPLTEADYSAVIQAHLDATARERNYDNIQTAVSYRDDLNPQFSAEGQALCNWRSAVWTAALAILDNVEAGNRTAPTIDALIAELPAMVWPT